MHPEREPEWSRSLVYGTFPVTKQGNDLWVNTDFRTARMASFKVYGMFPITKQGNDL